MLYAGLVSVTFRQLSPQRIIELALQAGLRGIEWSGDIHVRPGDAQSAKHIRLMMDSNGLKVTAYGSYYRVGHPDEMNFERVIETAIILGAPVIRVWAGKRGSADTDVIYRQQVTDDSRRIADLARDANVLLAYEFHSKTLTDSAESAVNLLQTVNHPNMKTFWQPPHTSDVSANIHGLKSILPWLTHVHIFHWQPDNRERFRLKMGYDNWMRYLTVIKASGRDHFISLEFVKDDSEQIFLDDAQTLHSLLNEQFTA